MVGPDDTGLGSRSPGMNELKEVQNVSRCSLITNGLEALSSGSEDNFLGQPIHAYRSL